MRVPHAILVMAITFLFPIGVLTAFTFGVASVGEVVISVQVALLAFAIQRYFWSEADYHAVKRFLTFRK